MVPTFMVCRIILSNILGFRNNIQLKTASFDYFNSFDCLHKHVHELKLSSMAIHAKQFLIEQFRGIIYNLSVIYAELITQERLHTGSVRGPNWDEQNFFAANAPAPNPWIQNSRFGLTVNPEIFGIHIRIQNKPDITAVKTT